MLSSLHFHLATGASQAAEIDALAASVDSVASSISPADVDSAASVIGPSVQALLPYVPTPYQPGWEIWVGFAAGVIPFAIGAVEFGKRIIIQQRCEVCGGKGLVASAGPGGNK